MSTLEKHQQEKLRRKEYCEGCATFLTIDNSIEEREIMCAIEPVINGKICPCSKCIVKSMCEDSCARLHRFTAYPWLL